MLAVAAVAILLTGAFYYRAFGSLAGPSSGERCWRCGRRPSAGRDAAVPAGAAAIRTSSIEKPALIFLLDTSASMSIADDASGVTRFNQARGKLEKWCEKLKDDFRLLPIAFAEQAELLEGPQESAGLDADRQGDLAARGRWRPPRSSLPPAEVAAVILLSDGIHNSAGNPLDVGPQDWA